MKRVIPFVLLAILTLTGNTAELPFNKGVNLTGWFQVGNAHSIHFTKYTKKDFENIKSLGCDVIRLPVNLHYMTDGSPDYNIDPLFYEFMDEVIGWTEDLDLTLIIDNHTFDPSANTDPSIGTALNKVWSQMAGHYKDSYSKLIYEVLNEPHGISDDIWNDIQGEVIETIRQYDTNHTIMVGPAGWNSYNNLKNLPVYNDDNLIYTFHFYDPFVFTHQGATWVEPSMAPLADIPFPYDANAMPECPESIKGSWVEDAFNDYQNTGQISRVKGLIDIAANFRDQRNVTVFCGEFGVYIPNSNQDYRVGWYEVVRSYLEEKNIPWTCWDYHGGFGIFEKGSNGLFDHDLNIPLLNALGFNTPEQTEYIKEPEQTGFYLYTDYMEQGIHGNSSGEVDFYAGDMPNNDKYTLLWENAKQYASVQFNFTPNRDLSRLVTEDYAIDFFYRGNTDGVALDIRFVDTKTGIGDRPWRMRYILDNQVIENNSKWEHLRIPLSEFSEHGSWDNGTWYNPEGKFDWADIDAFEIVAEQGDLTGAKIWFDNVIISNQDTAQIWQVNEWSDIINHIREIEKYHFSAYPNPTFGWVTVEYQETLPVIISLYNLNGTELFRNRVETTKNFDLSPYPKGVYFLNISNSARTVSNALKIVKL